LANAFASEFLDFSANAPAAVVTRRQRLLRYNFLERWHDIGGKSMSKLMRLFAGLILAGIIALAVPGAAHAQFWVGGFQAGWGWGPYLYYGWPAPTHAYYFPPRYYDYAPAPRCGWVRVRGWRHGHHYWRRSWRCW
jgi:hypothetical protein